MSFKHLLIPVLMAVFHSTVVFACGESIEDACSVQAYRMGALRTGTVFVKGTLVEIKRCPVCPPGAMCKPCAPDSIVISDEEACRPNCPNALTIESNGPALLTLTLGTPYIVEVKTTIHNMHQ